MRSAAVAAVAVLFSTFAWAQGDSGEIRGTLSSARGGLPGIEVRGKNVDTGEVKVTTTSAAGEYSLTLSPGTYDVFAAQVGYVAFARRQLVVHPGATVRADGVMGDNPNAGTPGEIPFLYQRAENKAPSGPAPRTADGKPDLSGVWFPGPDLEPEVPSFQPWAAAVAKERASRPGEDPRALCLPTGVARLHALDLAKFIQTPTLVVVLHLRCTFGRLGAGRTRRTRIKVALRGWHARCSSTATEIVGKIPYSVRCSGFT
jgi:hypothetical protein